MPVAFVISQPEEEIVNAVSQGAPKPRMDGSLFKFRGEDVKEFIERVVQHTSQFDNKSEEFRAGVRLVERLGGWIGEHTAESWRSERQETPAEEPQETPVDVYTFEDVPVKTRKRRG